MYYAICLDPASVYRKIFYLHRAHKWAAGRRFKSASEYFKTNMF